MKKTVLLMFAFWIILGFTGFLWDARQRDRDTFTSLVSKQSGELLVLKDALSYYGELYFPMTPRQFQSPMDLDSFRGYSSPFGIRLDPTKANTGGLDQKNHHGEDMVGIPDALVISIGKGEVVTKYYSRGWHKIGGVRKWFKGHPIFDGYVEVLHPNGFLSKYGHLDEIYVHEGQEVDTGTKLGRVSQKMNGKTTGPHLHFGLTDADGNYVQPFRYINMPMEVR